MNKYRFLFLLILGLSISACSDLEEEPVGLLSPEAYFTDLASLQNSVNAVYTYVHDRPFLVREAGMAIMLRGDMVKISDPGTRQERIDHDEFTDLDDNGNTTYAWPNIWQIVASSNLAIDGARLLAESGNVDQSAIDPVVAEAYFLRAFVYYHIVRQFGSVPYLTEPVSDVEAGSNVEKTPVADIYAGIISDLTFAKANLPNQVSNRALASKAAASAYLASVHLTMGSYQAAFDEAEDVIDNAGVYDLALDDDYQNLWRYDMVNASKEPIFNLDYIGNVGIGDPNTDYIGPLSGIRAATNYPQNNGWAVLATSVEVYNRWDGQDYRRAVSIDTTAVFEIGAADTPTEVRFDQVPVLSDGNPIQDADGNNLVGWNALDARNHSGQPFIAKYNRFLGSDFGGSGRASEQNYHMMRYAEVLLIAAEAAVEINNDGAAVNYLNQVRSRAQLAGSNSVDPAIQTKYPVSASPALHGGGVTVDEVLEERRLELAFEMKRWYDIVRRDLGNTANGDVFGAGGLEGAKANFNAVDDYLIAIPAAEVARNPNLGN
ncbi:MAG: RagB/SusD family nutrient uptake outer membrane protein [Reichenbachiella sp.]